MQKNSKSGICACICVIFLVPLRDIRETGDKENLPYKLSVCDETLKKWRIYAYNIDCMGET